LRVVYANFDRLIENPASIDVLGDRLAPGHPGDVMDRADRHPSGYNFVSVDSDPEAGVEP